MHLGNELPLRSSAFFSRLLRKSFHLLYHEFAWTYDLVAATVSTGLWNMWVLSTLPYLEGRRVLEIGHGPGHLMLAAKTRGVQIVGIDESRQMGRQASRRLRKAGYTTGLVNSLAQSLPFFTCTFDGVVSTFPSEYIFDPRSLTEIYRILRPGGSLIVLVSATLTGQRLDRRFLAAFFRWLGLSPDTQNKFHNVNNTQNKYEEANQIRSELLIPFHQAGFHVKIEHRSCTDSVIFLLIASKEEIIK